MPFFSEDRFREFVSQYKGQSKLKENGWEFYIKDGEFTIYRRLSENNTSLYEYRTYGSWSEVKPDTLAHVYLDLDFRKKWDKNMKSYKEFYVDDSLCNHFEMNYPWPLSNRDYSYSIQRKVVKDKNKDYQVILGESLEPNSFPALKGVIRIDNYKQNICITPNENGNGCSIFMDYFDDPKGNIPKSIINWAAKTGIPTFINNLKNACLQFQKENPNGLPLDNSDTIDL